MSGLLIAAPMRLEALAISAGARRSRVRRTGLGRRRSQASARTLLDEPGDALVVIGFGGGLEHDNEPGEVVVADEVHDPDGARVACAGAELLLDGLRRGGFPVRHGAVASVPRLAVGETRVRLRERGAIAVDMESAWLAPGAGGRPFAVIRVVADTPARELTRPWLTLTGWASAALALRRVAATVEGLVGEHGVHTVFAATGGKEDGHASERG